MARLLKISSHNENLINEIFGGIPWYDTTSRCWHLWPRLRKSSWPRGLVQMWPGLVHHFIHLKSIFANLILNIVWKCFFVFENMLRSFFTSKSVDHIEFILKKCFWHRPQIFNIKQFKGLWKLTVFHDINYPIFIRWRIVLMFQWVPYETF